MAKYSSAEVVEKIGQLESWYHTVEVAPGIFTPGTLDCQRHLEKLQLPTDCTGLRVLDVGASDGFFSILLEKRGAEEVIAIDHVPPEKTGFPVLQDIFDSNVKFINDNVYNLSVDKYGQFDIVLFLGVLYHLRNPLLALDRVRDVCRDELYVESHIAEELPDTPIMRFYPRNELDNNYTNWWSPTSTCLKQMLESTNFTVVHQMAVGDRAVFKCKVNDDSEVSYWRTIESGFSEHTLLGRDVRPSWKPAR